LNPFDPFMKILITGGAGFIGSHLVDRLIKEGRKVVVIDNLSTGKKENLNPRAKLDKIDICSPKISQIFQKEKPEIIFHLAAQIDVRKSVENPQESAKVNILGSLNILENCKKFKVKKIIFASTGGAIYGEAKIIPTPEDYPTNSFSPYGIEKLTIEKYLDYYWKIFKIPHLTLRLANVYGPRQNSKGEAGAVAVFCDKMLSGGQPIINGSGNQTRDFVFVEDVIEANILALKKNTVGVFNIGSGRETDIITIFKKIRNLTSSKCREIHGPEKPGEQKRSCLDWSKAKKELKWNPRYDIEKGLREAVDWFENH